MFHHSNSRVVSVYCSYHLTQRWKQWPADCIRTVTSDYRIQRGNMAQIPHVMLTDSSKLEPNKASGTGGSKQKNRPHSQDVSEIIKKRMELALLYTYSPQ